MIFQFVQVMVNVLMLILVVVIRAGLELIVQFIRVMELVHKMCKTFVIMVMVIVYLQMCVHAINIGQDNSVKFQSVLDYQQTTQMYVLVMVNASPLMFVLVFLNGLGLNVIPILVLEFHLTIHQFVPLMVNAQPWTHANVLVDMMEKLVPLIHALVLNTIMTLEFAPMVKENVQVPINVLVWNPKAEEQ